MSSDNVFVLFRRAAESGDEFSFAVVQAAENFMYDGDEFRTRLAAEFTTGLEWKDLISTYVDLTVEKICLNTEEALEYQGLLFFDMETMHLVHPYWHDPDFSPIGDEEFDFMLHIDLYERHGFELLPDFDILDILDEDLPEDDPDLKFYFDNYWFAEEEPDDLGDLFGEVVDDVPANNGIVVMGVIISPNTITLAMLIAWDEPILVAEPVFGGWMSIEDAIKLATEMGGSAEDYPLTDESGHPFMP